MLKKYQFKEEAGWSHADEQLLCLDTGSWRAKRPVIKEDRCNSCGICALFCPVQCMLSHGDHFSPDLGFCKGCGICARECPRKAIIMEPEGDF